MRRSLLLLILLATSACSAGGVAPSPSVPVTHGRQLGEAEAERRVAPVAREVVAALKARDGGRLAALAHPTKGVLFSPYAFLHPGDDVVLSPDELRGAFADPRVRHWGTEDGRGLPLDLTFAQYAARFVYDVDFAAAPQIAFNRSIGTGNTVDNSAEAFPAAVLVEYHFPQLDPRYGGMDWRSLRLLLEDTSAGWKLVGIVHAQWTI